MLIAADRHYEVFVNGRRVIRQRGFFNGDEYVFAQRWTSGLRPLLRAGENTIEIVIRSDPWRNKNYRCFRPMLILECTIGLGDRTVEVVSDSHWSAAVVEGWREMIRLAPNKTIHFERVSVPRPDQALLCGIPSDLSFQPVRELDTVPAFYLWNDPPIRLDTYLPVIASSSGDYAFPESALSFDVSSLPEGKGMERVLSAAFEDVGSGEFGLATSALFGHRMEFNGEVLCEREDFLHRGQMLLPSYLVPIGRAAAKPGVNTLRIRISSRPKGCNEYRLAFSGLQMLSEPSIWCDKAGRPLQPEVKELEIAEKIGAKVARAGTQPQAIEGEGHPVAVRFGSGRGFVIFDFGQVVSGRASMRFRTETPGRVYLAYGFNCTGEAVDCHRMHLGAVDVLELPAGESSYESFDIRTFRYLDLVLEGFEGFFQVCEIQVEEPVFADGGDSQFRTSDQGVDELWRAALRTAQLCTDELFVDNPEREHAQWLDGILYASSPGYYFFGERLPGKAAKALDEIALTQQPDGQLAGYAPGAWFPRIPLQCHMALYVLACHRHFMHTGDQDFAGRSLPTIERMVDHWERHRTRNGLISDLHTVFVDWGSNIYSYARGCEGPTGALTTMNAYYLGALTRAAEVARYTDKADIASRLDGIAEDVRRAMREQLYDPSLGLFRDGIGESLAERNISQTANVLAVLYGAAPEGEGAAIMTRAFGPEDEGKIIPANAFFALHVGAALFESGCDRLALNWLLRFKKMVQDGPGTLWETWEPHASQCQSSGSALAYLFARYLAGVYPAEPGFRAIGVDPHPTGLCRLEAVMTTSHGRIEVQWTQTANGLDYHLELPPALRDRPRVLTQALKAR